jgi:alpha-ribazole phosphatase
MKITLIRHTSVQVESDICYGQSNVPVAPTFVNEAERVKHQLNSRNFEAIFCSPLDRCTKLAHYCGYTSPIIDDRLMELNFGAWEMKTWDEIIDPQLVRWYANWVHEKTTNGESFMDLMERVQNFSNEIRKLNLETVAIFTHAGIIRSFLILGKLISIQNSFNFVVNYADIVELEIQ